MKDFQLTGRGPNTMTVASLTALRDFILAHRDSPILLYGAGNAFSAGLDLDDVARHGPRDLAMAIVAAADALFNHPAPTVAAVNGHAIAGGCLLVQACDLRIGTRDSAMRMGMPGVALGISYPPTLIRILRYRIPSHTIDRVLLEAANHAPEQALALGLLDALADDPVAAARERLAALAAHPPAAYAEAKRALREGLLDIPPDEQARFEASFATHWQVEAMTAQRRDRRGG